MASAGLTAAPLGGQLARPDQRRHVVLAAEPPNRLQLRARAWPSGEAEVEFVLRAEGDKTLVELREDAVAGPATLLPTIARHPMLAWRNKETLRRLAYVAEHRGAS